MAPNSSRKPTLRFLRHRFLRSVHVGQIPAWNLMRAFAFLEQLVVLKGARALPLSRINRVIVYSYKWSAPYANPHSANSHWLPHHYWWLVFQHDCSKTPRRSIYCVQKTNHLRAIAHKGECICNINITGSHNKTSNVMNMMSAHLQRSETKGWAVSIRIFCIAASRREKDEVTFGSSINFFKGFFFFFHIIKHSLPNSYYTLTLLFLLTLWYF